MQKIAAYLDNSVYAAAQQQQPDLLTSMLPLFIIFAIFYFLLIRPQAKRAKQHRAMVDALAEGAEVITGGGMLGVVTKAGEQFLTVKVADGVELKVQRHHISKVLPQGTFKSA